MKAMVLCSCALCNGLAEHPTGVAWVRHHNPVDTLELRVEALERTAHEPFDFAHLIERLERLERPVDSRDAIVWELGWKAAKRGEVLAQNPFRKVG